MESQKIKHVVCKLGFFVVCFIFLNLVSLLCFLCSVFLDPGMKAGNKF